MTLGPASPGSLGGCRDSLLIPALGALVELRGEDIGAGHRLTHALALARDAAPLPRDLAEALLFRVGAADGGRETSAWWSYACRRADCLRPPGAPSAGHSVRAQWAGTCTSVTTKPLQGLVGLRCNEMVRSCSGTA
ncbi:hypothetical protein GCM10023086_54820 [Streptomyces venetus]|uniref:Uncharacterized protein n=1 Tax=Streptomyces venetus TaxID=1701086 RepID=A0ABP8GMC0_9ACTN